MIFSRRCLRPLAGCLVLLPLLAGCGFMERAGLLGLGLDTCREPQAYEAATEIPPLQVPAGLDAPPARGALKIPALDAPERKRAANEPCLDQPPTYYPGRPRPVPATDKKAKN
jgi:uncharacterized lipoprotein